MEPAWSLVVLIRLAEFTTLQLSSVLAYWRDMRGKFPRSFLIPKATRFFRLVLIKLQECGTSNQANVCKYLRVMRIKFFRVCSTTKETQSSQVQRTTLVRFGGIHKCIRTNEPRAKKQIKNFKFITCNVKYSIYWI